MHRHYFFIRVVFKKISRNGFRRKWKFFKDVEMKFNIINIFVAWKNALVFSKFPMLFQKNTLVISEKYPCYFKDITLLFFNKIPLLFKKITLLFKKKRRQNFVAWRNFLVFSNLPILFKKEKTLFFIKKTLLI